MPRADVFSRRTDVFGGSFAADMAKISFPNVAGGASAALDVSYAGDVGLLVQRLQTTYQQQVTRLYEVGRPAIYYVGGRTSGETSVDRVVGPRIIALAFYKKYGDICQAATNAMAISLCIGCTKDPAGGGYGTTGADFVGSAAYTAYFCVIISIGLAIQAADMLVNESLRIMFSSFDYEVRSGVADCGKIATAATFTGTIGTDAPV